MRRPNIMLKLSVFCFLILGDEAASTCRRELILWPMTDNRGKNSFDGVGHHYCHCNVLSTYYVVRARDLNLFLVQIASAKEIVMCSRAVDYHVEVCKNNVFR